MKRIVIFAWLLIVACLIGCGRQANQASTTQTVKGISLSPKSLSSTDFLDFFAKAKQVGSIVSWAGDWKELENTVNGGPTVVAGLASTYGYIPIIEAQFFTQSTGQLLRPLSDATKEAYKNSAVAFAKKYTPRYLALGIEVNTLYEKSPATFEAFAQFFSEVYDAVKVQSPSTKVFTIFQLEKMKGLSGGLFGGTNDPSKNEWALLDKFPKSDLIAVTTYPGLIYKSPAGIPTDYYSEITSHTTKEIVFTEIGWHSAATPEGWESSETEQAEFVTRFFALTKNLSKAFIIWSFLYDPATVVPFDSTGLFNSDGTSKEAWATWLNN
ncbi:MAG: hypothetical protein PHG97_02435 [Candidatus Margulisbacteria bacterium]|nr:hypothetical protein [Candidatus Margulisiibacteriota bacterium]